MKTLPAFAVAAAISVAFFAQDAQALVRLHAGGPRSMTMPPLRSAWDHGATFDYNGRPTSGAASYNLDRNQWWRTTRQQIGERDWNRDREQHDREERFRRNVGADIVTYPYLLNAPDAPVADSPNYANNDYAPDSVQEPLVIPAPDYVPSEPIQAPTPYAVRDYDSSTTVIRTLPSYEVWDESVDEETSDELTVNHYVMLPHHRHHHAHHRRMASCCCVRSD